jgi:hypothetical protein
MRSLLCQPHHIVPVGRHRIGPRDRYFLGSLHLYREQHIWHNYITQPYLGLGRSGLEVFSRPQFSNS